MDETNAHGPAAAVPTDDPLLAAVRYLVALGRSRRERQEAAASDGCSASQETADGSESARTASPR